MSSTQQLLLGEGAGGGIPNFIEEVFSTYLYTGNGSTQTITNGINLSVNGGLVWQKSRSIALSHVLSDTVRGTGVFLESDNTGSQSANANSITAFNTTGFSFGSLAKANTNTETYVSWTFREQPKFFDVLTYTGDGNASRQVSHNLKSVPGFIIMKRTDTTGDWFCYARIDDSTYLRTKLNSFAAGSTNSFDAAKITSTYFEPVEASGNSSTNTSGGTYIAYLFAHNAGGFGLTGTDNVISCGSYVGTGGAGNNVTLGYEPQWVMTKRATGEGNWNIEDTMRGLLAPTGSARELLANSTFQEQATGAINLTSTGFVLSNSSGDYNDNTRTYIYIAIRRGPMKVPTSATTVFAPTINSGTGSWPSGFVDDLVFSKPTANNSQSFYWYDRLRGKDGLLRSALTNAELSNTNWDFDTNNGVISQSLFASSITYHFQRAPSFFDEVCYKGTKPTVQTVTHNLGVVPELIIVKNRTNAGVWNIWNKTIAAANAANYLQLQSDYFSQADNSRFNSTAPTASVFTVGTDNDVNESGSNLVAYLFATCAGVSKVGSYTGTGALQTINCGFTAGARFILIKCSTNIGDWFVWDSANGISSGNDPYLRLNTITAQVTGTNYVDTDTTGFKVTAAAPAGLNASGETYIFLAVA
jgi:hypothetical protein